jgi:H+/Cl- antiporter ClcA
LFAATLAATLLSVPLAFLLLGLFAIPLPALLGNGRSIAGTAFAGTHVALATLVAIVLLKPALTLLCLWSGSPGGLFTPMLSTGAALGLLAGELTGMPLAACAVIGAAALSGATMQAPVAATVLVIELTGSTQPLLLPVLLATATATLVTRYVDGYSVFSARLPAVPQAG